MACTIWCKGVDGTSSQKWHEMKVIIMCPKLEERWTKQRCFGWEGVGVTVEYGEETKGQVQSYFDYILKHITNKTLCDHNLIFVCYFIFINFTEYVNFKFPQKEIIYRTTKLNQMNWKY